MASGMGIDDGDAAGADAGGDLPTEEDSHRMFEAYAREHPGQHRAAPWGGPQDGILKRLLAASVKASGIRIGRFPR